MTRLTKDENVARGYAVYTPNGKYVKPITSKTKAYVDSGHVKLDEWGNPYTTDQFDADIKALPKPEMKSIKTGYFIDDLLAPIEVEDINELSSKMKLMFPVDSLHWLFNEKPAELKAMEKDLQAKLDAYWTPERKAIAKANQKAQDEYETAVIRIENKRRDLDKAFEKAGNYKTNAIARKNDPELAAKQDKISAIIEDKKRSSDQKIKAIVDGDKSAVASHNAKYTILMKIATLLGKGMDKDSIFSVVSKMDEFSALAYKRPEKEFNRIYKDTVNWIYYKNSIKVFWDLVAQVAAGMDNTKIRTKTKDLFYTVMTMTALHQAKDNESRGLLAFRYLSRVTVVSQKTLELDPRSLGEKFTAYANFGYLNFAKGVQGGVASRAGIKPFEGKLSLDKALAAIEAIMNVFKDSPFTSQLRAVFDELSRHTVVSQKTLLPPTYNNQELENAVEALLEVFKPLAKQAGDYRVAERLLDEEEWRSTVEAAKQDRIREEEETKARIDAHLASGVGFQPRRKVSVALSDRF